MDNDNQLPQGPTLDNSTPPNQPMIDPLLNPYNAALSPTPEATLPPPIVDQPIPENSTPPRNLKLSLPMAAFLLVFIIAAAVYLVYFLETKTLTYNLVVSQANSATHTPASEETITVNCGSRNCFTQKFTSCSAATETIAPKGGGTTVHYSIVGPQSGGCNMSLYYTENSIPAWDNKALSCDFNNKQSVNNAVNIALYSLTQNTNPYKCSGSFISAYKSSL